MAIDRISLPALCALALAFVLPECVLSAPAIPYDRNGHVVLRKGSRGAALKVEVYLDLACSDCAAAWPVMSEVAEAYGQQSEFVYRLFPLPYHHNAFTAAQAAKTVQHYSNGDDAAVDFFLTAVFDGQHEILNSATADMTQAEIEDIFSVWAVATEAVSIDDFKRGMSDSVLDLQTRYQFKYGCLHGVYGTPTVFVGGVMAEGLDGSATFGSWKDVLDPLVSPSGPAIMDGAPIPQ